MVSEIIHTGVQITPYVLAGVGVGAYAEHKIAPKVAQERSNLYELIDAPQEQQDPIRVSRVQRVAKRVGSVLGVSGGIAGAVAGLGWTSEDKASMPPVGGGLVVDRSGATVFGEGKTTPMEQIDKVIAKFNTEGDIKVTATVAHSGTFEDGVPLGQISQIEPAAHAPMREAFADALGVRNYQESDSENSKPVKNSTVVALTNGNSIGQPRKIIRKANEAHKSVYVVNVDPDIDNPTEESLKTIAEKTGGRYWDVSETELEEVPGIISAEVNPAPENADTNKGAGLLATMIGLSFLAFMARTRRKMPFTYKKGEL